MDDFYSQDMSNEFSFDQPLDQFTQWQSIDDYDEKPSSHSFILDDPEDFSQDFF